MMCVLNHSWHVMCQQSRRRQEMHVYKHHPALALLHLAGILLLFLPVSKPLVLGGFVFFP